MTDYGGITVPQNRGPVPVPEEPAPFWEVADAAWRKRTIEADKWAYTNRLRAEATIELYDRLDPASRQRVTAQMNGRRFLDPQAAWTGLVLDGVAAERAADPSKWVDAPADMAEFDARIDERRRTELREAEDVLALPGGGFAEFLGGAAREIVDPINIALAPLGLEGSAARIVVGEAVLGATAEGLSVPTERRVAGELGLPDPSLAGRMAEGAVFGGSIAGAFVGAGRFLAYLRGHREVARDLAPAGMPAQQFEAELQAARNEMEGSRPPSQLMVDRDAASAGVAAPGSVPRLSDFDFSLTGNASPRTNRVGYLFGRLLEAEMEPHIAAGFLGNGMVESGVGLHPGAVGDGGNALGIWQWNGPRRRELEAFAAKRGKPATDIDTQVAFLLHELRTSEAPAWAQIRAAKTAEEAAALISEHFERPGIPHLGRRVSHAKDVMDQYQGGRIPRWTGKAAPPAADAPTFATSRGYTRAGQVTAGDIRAEVTYEVVDASLLRRASGDLQPRDRSRAASDEQVAEIAAKLDPARLLPAPEADRGAPIVGPDNVIESGNGRVMAIQRVYERHPDRADAYRAEIRAAGFEVPEGVERPVLIARRTSEMDPETRRAFVREANNATVARMSPTERAGADAAALSERTLSLYRPGARLGGPENRDFAQAALATLPQAERAAMVDAGGALNAEGIRRLQAALFARAWSAPDIVARFAEADAGELRSLLDALADAAPAWAALRADIAAGRVRADMDITGHVLDAMRLIAAAREIASAEGKAVAGVLDELLADVDLLEGAVSPLTAALVRKFWRAGRAASKDEIAAFLTRYADEARQVGTTEAGLFGDGPGPAEVLRAIDRETFADLPDEFGSARGPVAPSIEDPQNLPETAWAKGADSPEAVEADAAAIDGFRDAERAMPELADVEPENYVRELALAQPFDDLDTAHRLAAIAQDKLATAGREIEDELGITFKDPGLKKRADLDAKMARKPYSSPRRLTDISRGGFLLKSADQAEALVAALAARFDIVDEGWVRNAVGYIDRKVIVRHDDGMLSEVQIWTDRMFKAKDMGTALYTEARALPVGDARRDALNARQMEVYSAASDDFAEVSFSADGTVSAPKSFAKDRANDASSPKMRADDQTSMSSTLVQPAPGSSTASAPAGVPSSFVNRTAGTRSQSQSSRFMGENPPVGDTSNMGPIREEVNSLAADLQGLTFRLDERGPEITIAELLDDIEADEELAQVLKLCNIGGAA